MEETKVTIEELHKEIDLVQGCITRMANNSFMIKGWTVGFLSALIAFSADRIKLWVLCLISLGIIMPFWWLDAFFLKMEKCYRFKYEWIIRVRPSGERKKLYDLNPYGEYTRNKDEDTHYERVMIPSIFRVMFLKPFTLLIFYGFLFVVAVILLIFSFIYWI